MKIVIDFRVAEVVYAFTVCLNKNVCLAFSESVGYRGSTFSCKEVLMWCNVLSPA